MAGELEGRVGRAIRAVARGLGGDQDGLGGDAELLPRGRYRREEPLAQIVAGGANLHGEALAGGVAVGAVGSLAEAEAVEELLRGSGVIGVLHDARLDGWVIGRARHEQAVSDGAQAALQHVGELLPVEGVQQGAAHGYLAQDGWIGVEELREEGGPTREGGVDAALRPLLAGRQGLFSGLLVIRQVQAVMAWAFEVVSTSSQSRWSGRAPKVSIARGNTSSRWTRPVGRCAMVKRGSRRPAPALRCR